MQGISKDAAQWWYWYQVICLRDRLQLEFSRRGWPRLAYGPKLVEKHGVHKVGDIIVKDDGYYQLQNRGRDSRGRPINRWVKIGSLAEAAGIGQSHRRQLAAMVSPSRRAAKSIREAWRRHGRTGSVRFSKRIRTLAEKAGVKLQGVEKTVGFWKGQAEQSFLIRAQTYPSLMAGLACKLGQERKQEAVGVFHKHRRGRSYMLEFEAAASPERLGAALQEVSFAFGTLRPSQEGRTTFIYCGEREELAAISRKLIAVAGKLGPLQGRVEVGTGRFIEQNDYEARIDDARKLLAKRGVRLGYQKGEAMSKKPKLRPPKRPILHPAEIIRLKHEGKLTEEEAEIEEERYQLRRIWEIKQELKGREPRSFWEAWAMHLPADPDGDIERATRRAEEGWKRGIEILRKAAEQGLLQVEIVEGDETEDGETTSVVTFLGPSEKQQGKEDQKLTASRKKASKKASKKAKAAKKATKKAKRAAKASKKTTKKVTKKAQKKRKG